MFKRKKTKKNKQSSEIDLVLLRTTNNNFELGIIKSILDDNNIPYIVKDYGAGGYMRIISGDSSYRTDILVEKSDYNQANEILEQITFE
ncbi:DUF2007 domain-containing protein [Tissierella praeacuta]|uniref:Putative signal transducing protein n=1 Tax=Tissierella praeacuta DSM 18095 TaxID=1123404 RepID=A0A1M4V9S4_9FIRM|nr:DUF2007 domain-containing protein [Tissierella praeacuta]MBU5257544.1 DUF2007 domain-containing protein [Tissierella praeacuta]SHE65623.1 Putative signal transducing protein [Tissierella praeacuta DSM 18095]SUP03066.1 Uncharacterised protein [Tissierella praeacuta]